MALSWFSRPPQRPTDLQVSRQRDKTVEISWTTDEAAGFEVEAAYLRPRATRVDPAVFSQRQEGHGSVACVQHPPGLPKNEPWVVKLPVKAKSSTGHLSEAAEIYVAWDDVLSEEGTKSHLKEKVERFIKKELPPFLKAKGNPRIIVIGGQHHGKSCLVNHLYRCLNCNLKDYDQMDQAPAGSQEKTMAARSLEIPLGFSQIVLTDTPALPMRHEDDPNKLKDVLSKGIKDGTHLTSDALSQNFFVTPPHGAIIVISLFHWRDQQGEMKEYLDKTAKSIKDLSEFPYVVAATNKDAFLWDSANKEDPFNALDKALDEIKSAALTDHVYPITNYMRNSAGSKENNDQTFDMLQQLLVKAAKGSSASCLPDAFSVASLGRCMQKQTLSALCHAAGAGAMHLLAPATALCAVGAANHSGHH